MLRRLASFFTFILKHLLPDAYLFAILLTFLTGILALIFTNSDFMKVITTWGNGIYGILAFTMQMILVLLMGYVLALSPPVQKILVWIANKAENPGKAIMIVTFIGAVSFWVNWGFGLVIGVLLAMEIAKRNRKVHFPLLVAAGYVGITIWHQGLSGSIPLLIATAKHPQNLFEKATGMVVPVSNTLFAAFNLLPVIILVITLPFLFKLMHPKEDEVIALSDQKAKEIASETLSVPVPPNPTLAQRIDHSYTINFIFAAMGLVYLIWHFSTKGLDLNLNIVIFIFFILGVILHGKPINYINAVNVGIKSCGGIALQFPLYGGIMGIMVGTGLAAVVANGFVAISNAQTFYMMQFWGAGLINMFVPSGGGQWVVQGPITIEAAKIMGIDPVKSAMMVAWGDQWTNLIQPFWALPVLGIAGLSAKDIMGYTAIGLIWAGVVLSAFALLAGFGVL